MKIKNLSYIPKYLAQQQVVVNPHREASRPQNKVTDEPSVTKKIGLMSLIVLGVSIYCESKRLNLPIFKGIVSRLFSKVFK